MLELDSRSVLLLLPFVLAAGYIAYANAKPRNLPPGPPTDWLGSNRSQLSKVKPWLQLAEWGKQYPLGCYTMWTGPKPTIVVTSAKVAADLLDKRSNIYSSRPRFVLVGELMTGGEAILFQPYGDRWKRQRKLYHLALNSNASRAYKPIQEAEAKRLAHDMMTKPDAWEKNIERFAASVVSVIAYGRRVDDPSSGTVASVMERMQEVGKLNLPGKQILDSYPFLQSLPEWITPYKKAYREMRKKGMQFWLDLADVVKQRVDEGTAPPSFTRDMLEIRSTSGLTDGEFGLLTGGILGAGVETTAGTLVAFVMAMVVTPEAQAAAQEELDRVVGRKRSPVWEDEAQLPYCSALLKEVLRWRPVAILGGTPHASTEDDVYEGFFIPKGSTILCDTWAIHRDPEYFPEPDRFDPTRYIDGGKGAAYPQRAGHSGFGWGRRVCPGQFIAERSLFIAIATVLHHFSISPGKTKPDIFAFQDGFNSRAEPFEAVFTPRFGKDTKAVIEKETADAAAELERFEV